LSVYYGNPELWKELQDSHFGVVCLTAENLQAPWLHFEAGALAKAVDQRACPYLYEIQSSDVQGPLSHFQMKKANKKETRELLQSMNEAGNISRDRVLSAEELDEAFETWWPKLEEKLKAVPPSATAAPPQREPQDMLEELLDRVRGLERSASARALAHLDVITSRPPRVQEAILRSRRGGSEEILAVFAQMSPEEQEQCDQWFVTRHPWIGQLPTAEHRFRTGVLSEISN
jgi:hypothetical protein